MISAINSFSFAQDKYINNNELSFLKKETPYIQNRENLYKNGWKPFLYNNDESEKTLGCLKRFYAKECMTSKDKNCEEQIEICTSFPEISGHCSSGMGYCMMIWENPSQEQLWIITKDTLDKKDRDNSPVVDGWRFDKWDEEDYDYE